nr:ECF RNA polymerase sigma factor SigK [Microcella putealis]
MPVATDVDAAPVVDQATALLVRVADGDQRAFSELYDLMASRMLGLVRHVLKDHAQSEEVVQEVLLEVWQTASRFDPNKGKAVTWMLTMAHRRAIDRVRSAQASRDRDTKIGIRDLGREVDTVSESAEISIEHKRVEKAMARLSDLQRQAVELAYYGGYTQSEVAEMLNIPLGTVKTRLRDGLIRLRTELGVAS